MTLPITATTGCWVAVLYLASLGQDFDYALAMSIGSTVATAAAWLGK